MERLGIVPPFIFDWGESFVMKCIICSSDVVFIVDSMGTRSSINSLKPPTRVHKQNKDMHILWFQGHKVNIIPNVALPPVVTTTITINNHSVWRILIDDKNSCDLMYLRVFTRLGLRMKCLKAREGGNLQAFNDSSTRLCLSINLPVSFCKDKNKKPWKYATSSSYAKVFTT